MRGTADTTIGRIHAALVWVEAHLGERISVSDVARRACYSPFHFHRMFTALTGETVMEYVRRRRLTVAADSLKETERPILSVALDSGFESQEAFTRAFKQQFGITPGRFRKQGRVVSSCVKSAFTLETLERLCGGVTMEPGFVDLSEFVVAGLSGRFTPDKTEGIPELWMRLVSRWSETGKPFPEKSYGICYDEGEASPQSNPPFTYMAAFGVEDLADLPDEIETRTIPANRYAVFTTKDGVAGIGETYKYIFGTWMPKSGYRRAEGPDFELYDERFDPESMEGEIDIYVPVQESE